MNGVRLEREGGVATIVIDRPAARNAIDRAAMRALEMIVGELENDPAVAAVILTGGGRGILSGGDINDLAQIPTAAEGEAMAHDIGGTLRRLSLLPCPVIAAIRGDAYGGGCELALSCDIRIIGRDKKMVFRQAAMGVSTGWGAGQRLARLVGVGRAIMLLSTAASVRDTEALMLGLVDGISDGEDALDDAKVMARKIASFDVQTTRSIKAVILSGIDRPFDEAFADEARIFGATWGGEAHAAAVKRFLGR